MAVAAAGRGEVRSDRGDEGDDVGEPGDGAGEVEVVPEAVAEDEGVRL